MSSIPYYRPYLKLTNFLSSFLVLDFKQIQYGLWSGDLEIHDVDLRREAVFCLLNPRSGNGDSPCYFNLKNSNIGEFKLQVPWKEFMKGQGCIVRLEVSDVNIVIDCHNRKEKKINEFRSECQEQFGKRNGSDGQSFLEKVMRHVASSLIWWALVGLFVRIRNVNVIVVREGIEIGLAVEEMDLVDLEDPSILGLDNIYVSAAIQKTLIVKDCGIFLKKSKKKALSSDFLIKPFYVSVPFRVLRSPPSKLDQKNENPITLENVNVGLGKNSGSFSAVSDQENSLSFSKDEDIIFTNNGRTPKQHHCNFIPPQSKFRKGVNPYNIQPQIIAQVSISNLEIFCSSSQYNLFFKFFSSLMKSRNAQNISCDELLDSDSSSVSSSAVAFTSKNLLPSLLTSTCSSFMVGNKPSELVTSDIENITKQEEQQNLQGQLPTFKILFSITTFQFSLANDDHMSFLSLSLIQPNLAIEGFSNLITFCQCSIHYILCKGLNDRCLLNSGSNCTNSNVINSKFPVSSEVAHCFLTGFVNYSDDLSKDDDTLKNKKLQCVFEVGSKLQIYLDADTIVEAISFFNTGVSSSMSGLKKVEEVEVDPNLKLSDIKIEKVGSSQSEDYCMHLDVRVAEIEVIIPLLQNDYSLSDLQSRGNDVDSSLRLSIEKLIFSTQSVGLTLQDPFFIHDDFCCSKTEDQFGQKVRLFDAIFIRC